MPSTSESTPAEELPEEERYERSSDAVNRLGHWLLSSTTTEPGWDQLIADFKPSRREPGAYLARITELRGEREITGSTGLVDESSRVVPALNDLRAATYTLQGGAWLAASIIIRAEGWPDPEYQVGSDLTFDDEPETWGNEAPLSGEDLIGEWERYPRDRDGMPGWMVERALGYLSLADDVDDADPSQDFGPDPESRVSIEDQAAAAAQEGEESGVVNYHVARALAHFSRKPTEQTIANVLRALMGGEVLLDVSGSTIVPGPNGQEVGPGSQIRVQAVQGRDGQRSLAVYLREETARRVITASGRPAEDLLLRHEPGVGVLENFVKDESLTDIIVEPNAPDSCRIEGPQVQWALNTPRNDAAKRALLLGSMQQLIGSFMGPSATLLLGMRDDGGGLRPVYAKTTGDQIPESFLVFTSAPEVAALSPNLQVRSVPALDALRLAVESGAEEVMVNALGPSARLPIAQVKELLEIAALQERVRTGA